MIYKNKTLIIKFIGILLSILFLSVYINAEESDSTYRIQHGDIIKITVLGEDELFRELRVSATGTISYPLLGEVVVHEKTTSELEKDMTILLNEYLVNPNVSVFVSEFSKIYVYGEVVRPGAFELSKKMTVIECITLAGGVREHANLKKVRIIRKKENKQFDIIVDLTTIAQKGGTENDLVLTPGDVIIVPESFL